MSEVIDNTEIIADLDGGVFHSKVAAALTAAGLAASRTGRQASVTIKLTYKPIEATGQAWVEHKLVSSIPHQTGENVDTDTKKTPVYIHGNGLQSITPENQQDLFATPKD